MDASLEKAKELEDQFCVSRDWQRDTYYSEWERVLKNYKCLEDARKDAQGKDDPTKTALGMPDTFSMVNRRTARVTAQIPDIGFVSENNNPEVNQSVSRKIMWDWDEGGIQRSQKRHVRQAELFGISYRAWWWEVNQYRRKKGIDLSRPELTPHELHLIAKTYGGKDGDTMVDDERFLSDPEFQRFALNALMGSKGKRGLLDVHYDYKAFEGPRSEVLFVGDCYPKPFFTTLQKSGYFIIERRRDRQWLEDLAKRYPEFQKGVLELFDKFPKGTDSAGGSEGLHLRDRMRKAAYGTDSTAGYTPTRSGAHEWTILERWTTGRSPKLAYVGERNHWFGEIRSPYDLDGRIPFSDLILIDDVLEGIGDSVARITQGLQAMHNLTVNHRFDLYRQVSEPLYGTTDRMIYDNPELIQRDGMRLVLLRGGPNSLFSIGEPQAMAAMAASMQEEASQYRSFQMASGDSNMSMAANVDPAQVRTATGARMLQANQDVLTKDLVDAFHQTCVIPDIELMYLLNRSEMADAITIDASKYDREYDPNKDARKEAWIKSEPAHFQVDGKLTVKLGSTLADDDEANVARATNLWQMFNGHPQINQQKLITSVLVAHREGANLSEWIQPQQEGPPPLKGSVTLQFDAEKLPEATQRVVLQQAGIDPQAVEQMQQQVQAEAAAQQQSAMPPPVDPAGLMPMEGPPQ